MDKSRERKGDRKPQVCACGRTRRSVRTISKQPIICPHCGTPVQESTGDSSLADTQMINVREMARIAQEGLDKRLSRNSSAAKQKGPKKSKRDTKS